MTAMVEKRIMSDFWKYQPGDVKEGAADKIRHRMSKRQKGEEGALIHR